jgi:pyruvyltransferase
VVKSAVLSAARQVPTPVRRFLSGAYGNVRWCRDRIAGIVNGNGIPACWCDALNFGDLITPALLRYYGFNPYHVAVRNCRSKNIIVSTGSILGLVPQDFSGIVLGSGFICPEVAHVLPNAKILALRGELTKELAKVTDNIVLGDPGLLANKLVAADTQKNYKLGIVPHGAEFANGLYRNKFDNRTDVKIIDPRRFLNDVLRDIAECENIASSSLHGLIVADALGIPNVWISFDDNLLEGKSFKFNDYYSALGINRSKMLIGDKMAVDALLDLMQRPPETVKQRQEQLHGLFSSLPAV